MNWNPRSRLALVLGLLLWVGAVATPAASASLYATSSAQAAAATRSLLTEEEREETFDHVWKTIADKYYDPRFNGVDWRGVRDRYRPQLETVADDEQFYTLLKQMVRELGDAHTNVLTPVERRMRDRYEETTIGLQAIEIDGRTVISSVDRRSEAHRVGVRPGMIVVSIDGKPIRDRILELRSTMGRSSSERALSASLYGRALFSGPPATTLRLELEDLSGRRLQLALPRTLASTPPKVVHTRLPSGLGYIRITQWRSPVDLEFRAAVEGLRRSSGVIIDLRGNRGGEVGQVLRVAATLAPPGTPFGRFFKRSGKPIALFTSKSERPIYTGPLVILTDEASASGSEMFAGVLQESGRATVIGRQSCGCLLAVTKRRRLKGGGELRISEMGYQTPGGRRLEGAGVRPDRRVEPTLEAITRGDDLAIEAAEGIFDASTVEAAP